jgi:hypothetical protein
MFVDPQSLTYATVAKSLPAIGRGADSSLYKLSNSDGSILQLNLSHQFKPRRTRAVARLQFDTFSPDPLSPANSILASATATLTVDFPTAGLAVVNATDLATCLVVWSTPGNLTRLLNGET